MANHKSAIKRVRSNKGKTERNKYQHKSTRSAIEKLRETTDKKEASSLLLYVTSMIDKLVNKNIIHKEKRCEYSQNIVFTPNNSLLKIDQL